MKKISAFLISILFCATVFSGCAKTPLPSTDTMDSILPEAAEKIYICRHLGKSIDNTWQIAENSWKLKNKPIPETTANGEEVLLKPIPVLVEEAFSKNPTAVPNEHPSQLVNYTHFRIYDSEYSYQEYFLFEDSSVYYLQLKSEKAVFLTEEEYLLLMNLTTLDSSPMEIRSNGKSYPMLWHIAYGNPSSADRSTDILRAEDALTWAPEADYTEDFAIMLNGKPYTDPPHHIYQNKGFMFDPLSLDSIPLEGLPEGQYLVEYRIPAGDESEQIYQLFFILDKSQSDNFEFSADFYQHLELAVGCLDQREFPYIYTSLTGDYTGIDVEIFNEIAKRYNWTINGHHIGNTNSFLNDFALEQGEHVDCFIGVPDESAVFNSFAQKTDPLYTDESGTHYFYVDADNTLLLNALNNAISNMKADGSIDRIREEFYNTEDFAE